MATRWNVALAAALVGCALAGFAVLDFAPSSAPAVAQSADTKPGVVAAATACAAEITPVAERLPAEWSPDGWLWIRAVDRSGAWLSEAKLTRVDPHARSFAREQHATNRGDGWLAIECETSERSLVVSAERFVSVVFTSRDTSQRHAVVLEPAHELVLHVVSDTGAAVAGALVVMSPRTLDGVKARDVRDTAGIDSIVAVHAARSDERGHAVFHVHAPLGKMHYDVWHEHWLLSPDSPARLDPPITGTHLVMVMPFGAALEYEGDEVVEVTVTTDAEYDFARRGVAGMLAQVRTRARLATMRLDLKAALASDVELVVLPEPGSEPAALAETRLRRSGVDKRPITLVRMDELREPTVVHVDPTKVGPPLTAVTILPPDVLRSGVTAGFRVLLTGGPDDSARPVAFGEEVLLARGSYCVAGVGWDAMTALAKDTFVVRNEAKLEVRTKWNPRTICYDVRVTCSDQRVPARLLFEHRGDDGKVHRIPLVTSGRTSHPFWSEHEVATFDVSAPGYERTSFVVAASGPGLPRRGEVHLQRKLGQ